jgi:hypothetical protein
MERYKNPVLAVISVVVFWLLAIASSPQIGLTVGCDKLPTPTTRTFTVTIHGHGPGNGSAVEGSQCNDRTKRTWLRLLHPKPTVKWNMISKSSEPEKHGRGINRRIYGNRNQKVALRLCAGLYYC